MLRKNKKTNDDQFCGLRKSPPLTECDFRLFQSVEYLNRALERKHENNEKENNHPKECVIL